MLRQRTAVISFIVAATLLLLTGCETFDNFKSAFFGDGKDPDSVIRIGVFQPLTGKYREQGELERIGIELAHEHSPKILGKEIELVYGDSKSDIHYAETAIQALIDKNPAIVLGSYGEVFSLMASSHLEESKVPAIAITNTNFLVTSNNPYYFRVCFVYSYEGVAVAKYAVEEMGVSTAAVLKPMNDDSATTVGQAFRNKMIQLTGDENAVVSSQDFDAAETDFADQLGKIKRSGAEVVFMPTGVDVAAEILKQARELGVEAVFLGTDNWETAELIEKAGSEAAEGIAFSTIFDYESGITQMTQVFSDAYREKYGEDAVPPPAAALAFDAYMVAINAIRVAGDGNDGEKVRKALASTKEFNGASGSITFDEKGDPIKSVVIKTVQDGEIVSAYTVEPVWVIIGGEPEPEEDEE